MSAPPEPTDPQYVCVSHMKIRWGRHRQNTKHTSTQWLGRMHWNLTPTSNVLRPRQPQQDAQARAARGAERETERCSWLLYRLKQHERQRRQHNCVRGVNMTFLAARSAGCPRTTDTGHRTVQRRVRRIETRGTENRRGEGGWHAFSRLRKREVKIY